MELTGYDLSAESVARFAHGPDELVVSEQALARVAASHEQSVRLSGERHVYGRSTGVGANRNILVSPDDSSAQALLASHATSAGALRSAVRIRAAMLIRLNQLCIGGAGIRPQVVNALMDLINSGALPPVREFSGIGTGDLSALATIGIAVQQASDGELVFGVHDALPFVSSNAASLADAALAVESVREMADASLVVTAMVFTAMDGNPEAFSPPVLLATPFPGAHETCRRLSVLLPAPPTARRIQDPYGLRVFPQVHGVLLDALAVLRRTTEALINAPSENPLVLPDGSLAHHGGFYLGQLAAAADAARSAVAVSAQLSLHRLSYLSEPVHTGLQPFLGDGTAGASGVMLCEYLAAAALSRLRAAAVPVAVQSVSLSRNVEDDASFASLACEQLLTGVADVGVVLACELVAAARAVRQRAIDASTLSPALAAAFELTGQLSYDFADRDLTGDLQVAQALLPDLAQILAAQDSSE